MSPRDRRFTRVLTLLALLAIAIAGDTCLAQDDADDDEEDMAQAVQKVQVFWTDANFDQWVFGNAGNAASTRDRLDSLLALQIEDVTRNCELTPAQKEKLRLAGRGDIKRIFDRVEEARTRFQAVKTDQNKLGPFLQEMQPLRLAFLSDPFRDGSFFAKALKRTLSAEQVAKLETAAQQKRLLRYRARVNLVVAMLGNNLGLDADQRRRVSKLLLDETQPPLKIGQYDYQVVMLQASKLPEEKIRPIFDDAQWRVLRQQFEQLARMELFLRDGGFLPGKPGDNAGPARRRGGMPIIEELLLPLPPAAPAPRRIMIR